LDFADTVRVKLHLLGANQLEDASVTQREIRA
jgi:hypothetical protein